MDLLNKLEDEEIRLLCLEKIGRELLVELMSSFVTRKEVKFENNTIVTSADPTVAVSQMLKLKKMSELKKLSCEKSLVGFKKILFSSLSPLTVADNVDISVFDVTALNYLLQNLSNIFPTSNGRYRRQLIACLGINHRQCCEKCNHKSSLEDCPECQTSHSSCFAASAPRCSACNMSSCVCQNLRDSLNHIRKLRNLLAHADQSLYHCLRNDNFEHHEYPSIDNWDALWNLCSENVLNILKYLLNSGSIDQNRYYSVMNDITCIIPTWSKEELFKQYGITEYIIYLKKILDNMKEFTNQIGDTGKSHFSWKIVPYMIFDFGKYALWKFHNTGIFIILMMVIALVLQYDRSNGNESIGQNISEGLAWSYYLRYLKVILPKFSRNLDRISFSHHKLADKRLFIIIPKEGCNKPFSHLDERIKFIEDMRMQTIIEDGGVYQHTFSNGVYEINVGGDSPKYVLMEYASPVLTLYDMGEHAGTGVLRDNRENDVDSFYGRLESILVSDPNCAGKYKLLLTTTCIGAKTDPSDQKRLADVIWNEIK